MTSINLTAAGSATDAIDLESLPRLSHRGEEEGRGPVHVAQQGVDSNGSSQETIAPPKWNHPPINKYRTAATFWSFLVVGMNDGSYGVRLTLASTSLIANCDILGLGSLGEYYLDAFVVNYAWLTIYHSLRIITTKTIPLCL